RPRRLILENWRVPRKAAIAIYQRIDARIVQRPRHVVQRKSIERVGERRKLPRADVASEIEHALAAALSFEEIFVAIERHVPLDILPRVSRQPREFRSHPAKVSKHATREVGALRLGRFRKGKPLIEFGGLAQLR